MKIIAVLLLIVLVTSCNKEELPEITDNGSNTFGMLVNGEIWLPYSPINILKPLPYGVTYYHSSKIHTLRLLAENTNKHEIVNLIAENVDTVGTYHFSYRDNSIVSDSADSTVFVVTNINDKYKLNDSINSVLSITRFDKWIVSGTFSLEMVDNKGNKLKITQGRFDIHYN